MLSLSRPQSKRGIAARLCLSLPALYASCVVASNIPGPRTPSSSPAQLAQATTRHQTTPFTTSAQRLFVSSSICPASPPPQLNNNNNAMSTTIDPRAQQVLDYWFSLPASAWFQSPTQAMDDDILTLFGPLVDEARTSPALEESWSTTPESTLALLILLDQFPRNIFRGSAQSFASDPQACRIATAAIARGFDVHMASTPDTSARKSAQGVENATRDKDKAWFRRMFFYLPLMHAEDLAAQVACVALFEVLASECPRDRPEREFISLDFAERHRDCVLLHGRFPKRNAWLGRESTEAERKFLEEKPMGF